MNENPSVAEVNSTDLAKREKWNAYMRSYRKNRKLAKEALQDAENNSGGQGIDEERSLPLEAPGAPGAI